MKITNIKINGIHEPLGYYMEQVVVSWQVEETISTYAVEKSVEISKLSDFSEIVCKLENDDAKSEGSIFEIPLEPYTKYYVRITVKGNLGDSTQNVSWFETAKLKETWSAKWIGTRDDCKYHPMFIKKFSSEKSIIQARLYICGLGAYEAYINGKKVGNSYLSPGLFDYTKEYQYQTYDITKYINEINQMTVLLGKSWYMGRFGLEGKDCLYGEQMALICEIHLTYKDGKKDIIVSDDSWYYKGSDIEDSSIYDGEIYNKMLWEGRENPYHQAKYLFLKTDEMLVSNYGVPLKEKEEVPVIDIIKTPKGDTILDFGQNMAGYVKIKTKISKGHKIVLDFGEILQNNEFYNENYRTAKSQFTYISDGKEELIRPHFTYFGFRYVKVTGWIGEIKKEDFVAAAVYSDLDKTGSFTCSNEKINRLFKNSLWGLYSNFVDVPTDCPQRDERMAWTGDAQAFAPTACYHMDTRVFYHKFLHDLRNEQVKQNGGIPNYFPNQGNLSGSCAVWGDIATFLPYTLKRYYGNQGSYRKEYDMMKDWVEYVKRECMNEKYLIKKQHQFGDWLALDGVTEQSMRGGTDDEYIAGMFFYESARKTAELGKQIQSEDWEKYEKLAKKIKTALLKEYFSQNGRLCIDTQTGYLLALHFKVYQDRESIIQGLLKRLHLDAYKIRCGFVGATILCQILAENDMVNYAYEFLFNEEFPGWLYCVNLGATTIWERWNSVEKDGSISGTGMNSLNHYAYGNVAEFLYAYVAGIRPDKDSFEKVVIAPEITGRFTYVKGEYQSVYGKYVCNWEIEEDGKLKVHVEVPFDRTAEIKLPDMQKQVVIAGNYDYSYYPKTDVRCIYNENTMLKDLCKNPKVVEILQEYVPQALWLGNGDIEGQTIRLKELKEMFYMGVDPVRCQKAIELIEKLL